MAIASSGIARRDDQRLDQVLEDHIILGQRGEVQQPGARRQNVLRTFKGKGPIEDEFNWNCTMEMTEGTRSLTN
ncbi:hypothetical protein F25303_3797 [Fusarium sp. NRRL 25303]|nr:hypothetical protein F25303_3797 [Fusarium sp. NRRL 25303]